MDPIFNMHKVKFSKLDELLSVHSPELNPGDKVNVFINLESVLKKLTAAYIDDYLKIKSQEKQYEMISNMINLISHYRLFFTKNKIYSNIYLYMNFPFEKPYKNRLFNPDYRKYYEHRYTEDKRTKMLNYVMENTIPIAKIILEYVENVHFISAENVESSMVPQIINQISDNKVQGNFIVTTDRYDYQYALMGYKIIRPKKDHSYVVTDKNLINVMKMEEKIIQEATVEPTFYPFILSMLEDKYRNITKIRGVGLSKIITAINKAIDLDIINSNVKSIHLLSTIIKEDHRQLLVNNFNCIDIPTQTAMLNSRDYQNIKVQCVNKFDNVSLKKLNDKYFRFHPISLLELTSANTLIKKKKKDIFL